MSFCMAPSQFILVFILFISLISSEEDLYKILGVRKTATNQEIKKAYKNLAREWHPDKNQDDPNANDKFIKINEAYETLSNAEKRSQYDNFGTTSSNMGQDRHSGQQPGFHGFESFFNGHTFSFNFGGGGETNHDKFRMTIRSYESKVVPESHQKPYLLYAYADFCYMCMQVQGIWERVRGDLMAVGVGVGTINVHMDQPLAHRLRLSSIPAFIAIVRGKPVYYSSGQYSVQNLRDFVKNLVPADIVTELSDSTYEDFLTSWQKTNKVRMILCDNGDRISLRYTFAAFAHRQQVLAGYIQTNKLGTQNFRKKFDIKDVGETLLIFNENMEEPVAQIYMKTISHTTMNEVIESNDYLKVPRLSSQTVFDYLCPPLSSKRNKKICVVLLMQNVEDHYTYLNSFRKFAMEHQDPERVKYGYVWEDTQVHFVRDITKGKGPTNNTLGTLKVAVVWRKDKERLLYDWLEDGWYLDGTNLQQSRRRLSRLIDWTLQSNDILPLHMVMSHDLVDEHKDGLWARITNKLTDWCDAVWDFFYGINETTWITLGTTIFFIILLALMAKSMMSFEEQKLTQQSGRRTKKKISAQRLVPPAEPTVYIHPLCADNFEDLLIRTELGVRTIVILVDEGSRHKLLQEFARIVHPYTRTEAFSFAFLQLEQYLPWYRRLLEESIDFKRKLHNINLKNCIGTVIAVNGPRKYFCMYHALTERMKQSQNNQDSQQNGGAFMGFDDSSDEELDMMLFESDLLAGFGTWMERLSEGSLKRYRVDLWPNMHLLSS